MKSILIILTALLLSQLSFAGKSMTLDGGKSKVSWHATKIGGEHRGTINFKLGSVTVDDSGKLKSAVFTVDMKSINCVDLSGEWKQKFETHLHSDDFFSTAKFPSSNLVLDKVLSNKGNTYKVSSFLTIKGIKQPIVFNITFDGKKASGKLVFDRTKFNIRYGSKSFFSDLGDKVIHDKINLSFNVSFK